MSLTNISLAETLTRQKIVYWLDATDISTLGLAQDIIDYQSNFYYFDNNGSNNLSSPGTWLPNGQTLTGAARPVLKWSSKVNRYHFISRADVMPLSSGNGPQYLPNPFYSYGGLDPFSINGLPAVFNPHLTRFNMGGNAAQKRMQNAYIKRLENINENRTAGFATASKVYTNNPVCHSDFTVFIVMKAKNYFGNLSHLGSGYGNGIADASLFSMGYGNQGSFQIDSANHEDNAHKGFLARVRFKDGNGHRDQRVFETPTENPAIIEVLYNEQQNIVELPLSHQDNTFNAQITAFVNGGLRLINSSRDYAQYVENHPDLVSAFAENTDGRTKAEFGEDHWLRYGQGEYTRTPPFTSTPDTNPVSDIRVIQTTNTHITPHAIIRLFANRGGGKSFPCSIGEILILQSIDVDDRHNIRKYLSNKWSIDII